MTDDLAEGSLFAELQIASWPPPVTQTLLRKSDGRIALTVRGKPSGRLRVALDRAGYPPLVVRSVHLRLRAPTVLKVNVVWRGMEAVVAAAGQVIGSSREFDPQGVVTPRAVEETAVPIDHVDNGRVRDLRRRQAEGLVSGSITAGALAERLMADLGQDAAVLADLATMVREGRRHHLPGLLRALRLLVLGDDREPALLQFCAGMLDAPLILYAPTTPAKVEDPAARLAAALDVASVRDAAHELAIDLDAWLRLDVPWDAGGTLPLGWLLRQAEEAVRSEGARQGRPLFEAAIVRSAPVVESLCRLAADLCRLAGGLLAAEIKAPVEPPTERPVQP